MMKWVKAIVLLSGGLVTFALLMVIVAIMSFDDDDYRRLAIRSVKAFTGATIAIDGAFEFSLSAEPYISAESIHIISPPEDASISVGSIGKLHVQITLWPLLKRIVVVRKLLIEDVAIAISIGDKKNDNEYQPTVQQATQDVNYPILERVSIRNARFDVTHAGSGRTVDIALQQFTVDSINENESMHVKGEGAISGKAFHIYGQLGSLAAILSATAPYPLALHYRSDELRISATGTIEDVIQGKGVALKLNSESEELSSLLQLLRIDTPPLGKFVFQANVGGDVISPSISELSLILSGNPQLDVSLEGRIANAWVGSGIDVRFSGLCKNPVVFSGLLPNNWPRLELLRIKGVLRDSSGMITIEDLEFESAAEQISLKINGRIPLLDGKPTVGGQLDTSVTIANTASLNRLLGASIPDVGPVVSRGKLLSSNDKVVYNGEIRVGSSVLESKVETTLRGTRPRIEATCYSTRVNLEDFGADPSTPGVPSVATDAIASQTIHALFSDQVMPFDALKAVDISLALNIDEVVFKETATGKVNIGMQLEDGRLHIYPASIVYAEGTTTFDVLIDTSQSPPKAGLKLTGEDVDIGEILAIAQQPMVLGGDLNVTMDMQSAGHSARELVSNLDGTVHLALENGEIRRVVEYLSADALNLVLNTADQRPSTTLNCLFAGIQFRNGIGEIDWFTMDTSRLRAKAAGSVNLATETIDIAINPKEKQRLLLREGSAVQIYGPMRTPSIRVLPLSEAARLYGKLLMPYVFLSNRALGRLWYMVSRDGDTSPCLQEVSEP